jgi:hypothetical protein
MIYIYIYIYIYIQNLKTNIYFGKKKSHLVNVEIDPRL